MKYEGHATQVPEIPIENLADVLHHICLSHAKVRKCGERNRTAPVASRHAQRERERTAMQKLTRGTRLQTAPRSRACAYDLLLHLCLVMCLPIFLSPGSFSTYLSPCEYLSIYLAQAMYLSMSLALSVHLSTYLFCPIYASVYLARKPRLPSFSVASSSVGVLQTLLCFLALSSSSSSPVRLAFCCCVVCRGLSSESGMQALRSMSICVTRVSTSASPWTRVPVLSSEATALTAGLGWTKMVQATR